MQPTIAWLGLDAHAKHCVLAQLDDQGHRVGHWQFDTTEAELIRHLQAIQADQKRLVVEECGWGRWIAQRLKPYLTEIVVCDPTHNALVSRHPHKHDIEDAYNLARLYRLGELKALWQSAQDHRAIFKTAVGNYLDAVQRQTALKQQLKAQYRSWGVMASGQSVYDRRGRAAWLAKLPDPDVRAGVELHYALLDAALKTEALARRLMTRLGRRYPEIGWLRSVPGVGPIGAHVFVALIQDPRRFRSLSQLTRYCRLGIRDRSSDGKPLGYRRLDRSGHGALKAITYRAWLVAVKRKTGPVYAFYSQSLERTSDEVHARLNTQRKVLRTLWVLWQKGAPFEAKNFLGTAPQRA